MNTWLPEIAAFAFRYFKINTAGAAVAAFPQFSGRGRYEFRARAEKRREIVDGIFRVLK